MEEQYVTERRGSFHMLAENLGEGLLCSCGQWRRLFTNKSSLQLELNFGDLDLTCADLTRLDLSGKSPLQAKVVALCIALDCIAWTKAKYDWNAEQGRLIPAFTGPRRV